MSLESVGRFANALVKIGQYDVFDEVMCRLPWLTFFGPPCILRTDRPTNDLAFGKISNGHISARGRPIHFMFGSTVGFSGMEDRIAQFRVGPNSKVSG